MKKKTLNAKLALQKKTIHALTMERVIGGGLPASRQLSCGDNFTNCVIEAHSRQRRCANWTLEGGCQSLAMVCA